MGEALSELVKQGILGALAVILLFAVWWKDRQLTKERNDAQALIIKERERCEKEKTDAQAIFIKEKEVLQTIIAKERQATIEEASNRIKDAAESRKVMMEIQAQTITAVHKIAEVTDYMEKREEDLRTRGRRPP